MNEFELERDPVEALAEAFLEKQRRGEAPSVEDYAQQHPELAEEIRDLFPTIAAMEKLKTKKEESMGRGVVRSSAKIEQLGDYRIICEIGRGGMGIVYEAEQISLRRRVAVKVLPQQTLLDEKRLRRFEREARTAARLHHTNIVPVFGFGRQDGIEYYVMQVIRGAGLDDIVMELQHNDAPDSETAIQAAPPTRGIQKNDARSELVIRAAQALREGKFAGRTKPHSTQDTPHTSPTPKSATENLTLDKEQVTAATVLFQTSTEALPLPEEQSEPITLSTAATRKLDQRYWKSVARIGVQLADALHYAHTQGTLHRDIKPANVLLDMEGTVWITDFGLAKAFENDNVTRTGDIVGTLQYMAPEQFQGKCDSRSDIYSLGLTLYELLTLRSAYEDTNRNRLIHKINQIDPPRPRKYNPAVPRDLETIILKAASRNPHDRYQTAEALRDDLERFLEDRPIRARHIGPGERFWRWCKRNPAVAGWAAAAVTLLLVVAGTTTAGYFRAQNLLAREAFQKQQAVDAKEREANVRKKAEKTSLLAVEALDEIFQQLAPERVVSALELTVQSEEGDLIDVPVYPVQSKETAALLERLLDFYDRLAKENVTDDKLRHQTAKASRRVGDIQQRLGQFGKARTAYQRSVKIYGDLIAARPSADLVSEMASVYNAQGNLFWKTYQFEQAEKTHQKAIDVLQKQKTAGSTAPRIRYELARTYYYLGRRSRNSPGAKGNFDPKFKGPFGTRFGAPPGFRGRGPSGSEQKGRQGGRGGRPAGKGGPPDKKGGPPNRNSSPRQPDGKFGADDRRKDDEFLAKAVQLLDQLVKEYPAVPAYRHLLALSYREQAGRLGWRDFNAEMATMDKAIELLKNLSAEYPDVPDYRFDLSETYARWDAGRNRGFMERWSKERSQKVRQHLTKAAQILEELIAEYPNVTDYLASQPQVYHKLGSMLWLSRDYAGSEKNQRKAVNLQSALVRRFPDDAFYRVWKTKFQLSLARLLSTQKKWSEAKTLYVSAHQELEDLLKSDAQLSFLHLEMAWSYTSLAAVLQKLNESKEAELALRKAQEHGKFTFGRFMRSFGRGGPPDWRRGERGERGGRSRGGRSGRGRGRGRE